MPHVIVEHIAHKQRFLVIPNSLAECDELETRRGHLSSIHAHQWVRASGVKGQGVLRKAVREGPMPGRI
jgi:hypothetical protein